MITKTLLISSTVLAFIAGPLPAASNDSTVLTLRLAKPANVTSGDDVERLKNLAGGVGWEFQPNQETTNRLGELGIRRIRCINVDGMVGWFAGDGIFSPQQTPDRLAAHLNTCREIGAQPHIIIGQSIPSELRIEKQDAKERLAIMGQTPGNRTYWNGDWEKLRAYWKAIFQYVLIDSDFPNARFEVGNEPDIDGQFPRLVGEVGGKGSRKLYDSYFEVYKNAAQAAAEFEKEHPGTQVKIGGPALSWAYTFRFGEVKKWASKFMQDCSEQKVKLDFLGIHYYGNISSLHGEYASGYPSFDEMWKETLDARDRYCPGLPIRVTEWGASYHTDNEPRSMVNADNVGAAWSADFLKTMLESGVEDALYLVTTDRMSSTVGAESSNPYAGNVWGWPSFFVNPNVFRAVWPKAPSHVFGMIQKLAGTRIAIDGSDDSVRGIASVDPKGKKVTLMVWNYKSEIPEGGEAINLARDVDLRIALDGVSEFFGASRQIKTQCWMVGKDLSNAWGEFQKNGTVTEASELQPVQATNNVPPAAPGLSIPLPASSVLFIEWTAGK